MTAFRDYAEDFLHRRTPALKPRSVAVYRYVLRHYLAPLHGVALECLTRRVLRGMLDDLRRQGLGEGTVRNARALLAAVLRDAVEAERLATNPLAGVRPGRYRPRPPTVLDAAELTHFLQVAAVRRPDLYPLWCCCGWAGLRIGEAMALQAGDVTERALHVRRNVMQTGQVVAPKSGVGRCVMIGPHLAAALAPVVDTAALWLFPGPCGVRRYSAIQRAFADVVRLAGLPVTLTPHSLRHSYASQLVQEDVNLEWLRRALGHAHISTTMHLYGRWLPLARPPALRTR